MCGWGVEAYVESVEEAEEVLLLHVGGQVAEAHAGHGDVGIDGAIGEVVDDGGGDGGRVEVPLGHLDELDPTVLDGLLVERVACPQRLVLRGEHDEGLACVWVAGEGGRVRSCMAA